MPVSVSLMRKLDTVDAGLRDVLYSLLEEVERTREESVTKKEFGDLTEIVREIGQIQKRTEVKMEELTEAQKRTEVKMEELTDAQKRTEVKMEELTDAQKRTEVKMEELTDAQKQTEVKVEELAEAQKRTEIKVEEIGSAHKELVEAQKGLADAQQRTEVSLRALAEAQKETQQEMRLLAKEVGGLALSVSYGFENEVYRMLPGLLQTQYGIEMTERMVRAEIGGKEVNLFGRGRHNGKNVVIVGEVKLRLDERREKGKKTAFDELEEKVQAVQTEERDREIVRLLITHYATKGFLRKAKERKVIVVESFAW